jgi:hypothetical protein
VPSPPDRRRTARKNLKIGLTSWTQKMENTRRLPSDSTGGSVLAFGARQSEPFDPSDYEDEDAETVELERQSEIDRSATDRLLVERANEWLLEEEN